ncbi:hypothetical protein DRE_03555 [Drechslerella stenobrocha 248]|uniref:Uncharacterized protein n=1 Tax=Drechslerella stenobrocha 248 TaxID=1043628 RepID=W7HSW9_9PEZI|nr:hypothetical protein DRE_03555 [Drechslerella stenobrocha 248]
MTGGPARMTRRPTGASTGGTNPNQPQLSQLSQPSRDANQNNVRRDMPFALSPTLDAQVYCRPPPQDDQRTYASFRPNHHPAVMIPPPDFAAGHERQHSAYQLRKRFLDDMTSQDTPDARFLARLDTEVLARGITMDEWSRVPPLQRHALFEAIFRIAVNEYFSADDVFGQLVDATVSVVHKRNRSEENVAMEKEWLFNTVPFSFAEGWKSLRPDVNFDRDPLALWSPRVFPRSYPASGQLPPPPSPSHSPLSLPQVASELAMILKEIRQYAHRYYTGANPYVLQGDGAEFLLQMCGGSIETIRKLANSPACRYLFVAAFIKRVLFNVCLGSGWFWQGLCETLSGLFEIERDLYTDPGYNQMWYQTVEWRAHRFTQFVEQPWFEPLILERRSKRLADKIHEVLEPLQGRDSKGLFHRNHEVYNDLQELVECFARLAGKMYEKKAMWPLRFPQCNEPFSRLAMFSVPQWVGDGTPLVLAHTPILHCQTPQRGTPNLVDQPIVKAECLLSHDIFEAKDCQSLIAGGRQLGTRGRVRKIATMPALGSNYYVPTLPATGNIAASGNTKPVQGRKAPPAGKSNANVRLPSRNPIPVSPTGNFQPRISAVRGLTKHGYPPPLNRPATQLGTYRLNIGHARPGISSQVGSKLAAAMAATRLSGVKDGHRTQLNQLGQSSQTSGANTTSGKPRMPSLTGLKSNSHPKISSAAQKPAFGTAQVSRRPPPGLEIPKQGDKNRKTLGELSAQELSSRHNSAPALSNITRLATGNRALLPPLVRLEMGPSGQIVPVTIATDYDPTGTRTHILRDTDSGLPQIVALRAPPTLSAADFGRRMTSGPVRRPGPGGTMTFQPPFRGAVEPQSAIFENGSDDDESGQPQGMLGDDIG